MEIIKKINDNDLESIKNKLNEVIEKLNYLIINYNDLIKQDVIHYLRKISEEIRDINDNTSCCCDLLLDIKKELDLEIDFEKFRNRKVEIIKRDGVKKHGLAVGYSYPFLFFKHEDETIEAVNVNNIERIKIKK
ncbi:MAG: hypothetical protein QXV63_02085 [Candidatus Aenigmatarchaeota archaeon]